MKLPEFGESQRREIAAHSGSRQGAVDLATLHCLRSIAVNLEVIAVFMGLASQDIAQDAFDKGLISMKKYSVNE